MKTLRTTLLLLLFVTPFVSCKKDKQDDCYDESTAYVIHAEGPSEAIVNTPVKYDIDFGVSSGCGYLGRYETEQIGKDIYVSVIAAYSGCICTMEAPVRSADYLFTPNEKGNYTFHFKAGPQVSIKKQLEVK